MKGDYLYCLNPSCHKLFKSVSDDKHFEMCPYCLGTNNINANDELYNWKEKRMMFTKDSPVTISPFLLEEYVKYLKTIGVLQEYKIQLRRGRMKQNYLYNTTDYSAQIKKQAKKQGITITYKNESKLLNKRVPNLSKSRGTKHQQKPNLNTEAVAKEVLGHRTSFDIRHKNKKDRAICSGDN